MISTAAEQTWAADRSGTESRRRRAEARRRVEVIDEMLDVLELMHLQRDRTIDRLVRARVRRLESEVGLPLPRKVARARNTVRLHAALLDWQDQVLDEVVPGRRALLEAEEAEEAAWPGGRSATPPLLHVRVRGLADTVESMRIPA